MRGDGEAHEDVHRSLHARSYSQVKAAELDEPPPGWDSQFESLDGLQFTERNRLIYRSTALNMQSCTTESQSWASSSRDVPGNHNARLLC